MLLRPAGAEGLGIYSRFTPPVQANLARGEKRYCGGLAVLGRGVVPVRPGVVLGRGAAGTPPAAGCAGTPDLAL